MSLRYLSVASGIEAASVAWHPLGFVPVAFSEIDKFPSALLQHHYPGVPNAGDFIKIEGGEYGPFDILVGGTPCQSFSVAGKRAGMSDARGNLALEFIALAYRSHPQWVLWENVPGVLSSSRGADFRDFLCELTGVEVPVPGKGWKNSGVVCGQDGHYSVAWCVLDAQYFGVPQRRRRVFLVGHLGDWRRAASVLLEPESLLGHPPPSRQPGQRVAPCLDARTKGGGADWGSDFMAGGGLAALTECANPLRTYSGGNQIEDNYAVVDVSPTLRSGGNRTGGDRPPGTDVDTCDSLIVTRERERERERGCWWDGGQLSQTLDAVLSKGQCLPEKNRFPAVLVPQSVVYAVRTAQTSANGHGVADNIAHTLDHANEQALAFVQNSRDEVRLFGGDGQTAGAVAAEPGMKQQTYIAFTCKDHGADAGDLSPTLRGMSEVDGNANSGGQVAVVIYSGRTLDHSECDYCCDHCGKWANECTCSPTCMAPVVFESRFARNGRGAPSDLRLPLKAQSGDTDKGDGSPLLLAPAIGLTNRGEATGETTETMRSDSHGAIPMVSCQMAVRRLTPRECERLQGFPDDYTFIPYNKKPTADGPRYKAIGNSMAVPCMAWIGKRIQTFSDPDWTRP